MITGEEERYILSKAYVPEHVVGLMTTVSGGEAFLFGGYFCCAQEDWVIVVGYPLNGDFEDHDLEAVVKETVRRFNPAYVWIIAPKLPASHARICQERESDQYYTLTISPGEISGDLRRMLNRAKQHLSVENSREVGPSHEDLSLEFIRRVNPQPRIRELLLKVPDYVRDRESALVLNAWDSKGRLSAFYVIDLGAQHFSTYVIGCHSKRHYVPGASDLLFSEMIGISSERGKAYIHLGLGVNEGIRRFKTKWGGRPTLPYEMCGLVFKRGLMSNLIRGMHFFR